MLRIGMFLLVSLWGSGFGYAQDSARQGYQERTERRLKGAAIASSKEIREDRAALRQNLLIEQLSSLSRESHSFLNRSIDTTNILMGLREVARWHALARDGIFENQGGTTHSYRNLTLTYILLGTLSAEVEDYKLRLDRYQQRLLNYRFRLDSLGSDSALFILPHDSLRLDQYVQRLNDLAAQVNPVTAKLARAIAAIRQIQDKVDLELTRIASDREEINYLQNQVSLGMLGAEFVPLWQAPTFDRPLPEILYFSLEKAKLVLLHYLRVNLGKVFLSILGILLAVGYLYRLRGQLHARGHADLEKGLLLKTPLFSGILIAGSILQFIFPSPPFIFIFSILIVNILLTYLIVRKSVTRYWLILLGCITLLFAIAGLDNLFLQPTRPERWFMLLITLLSAVTGLVILTNKAKHKELPERWILYPIALMLVMEVGASLLNVFGRLNLAKVMMVAGLMNIVAVITLLWVLRLVNEGLQLLSTVYQKQERKLFYINYSRVGQRAPIFFYVLLLVGWFVIFGRNFYAFKLLSEPLKAFFHSEHQLGGYRFSVSNFSVFVLIMVCASVLSKVVSYFASNPQWDTREEQQDKGFHLGSWVLLIRISIISIGFFLAISAIGIPVEQIGIVIGALGVGIGFGLQTLVNNLVSGLIIAFEKPVNVDDTIEINGQYGKVKSIGFRSSVISTANGADLILPNGDLLNAHVINWTLGGFRRRLSIGLTIKYGSDLEKVREILLSAVNENKQVLQVPGASVEFTDLSARTVKAELCFWVRTVKDASKIKSKVIGQLHALSMQEIISLSLPAEERIVHLRDPLT